MNLIVDEMIPYLRASGIQFTRNNPGKKVGEAIRVSNAGNYDLHLAIHSNAAPSDRAGKVRGTDVYYFPSSKNGERFSDIVVKNFKKIYPNPDLVKKVPTTKLVEVVKTKAPTVLIETAYHDNPEDASWIRNNINSIAKNLVESLKEYFNIK